MVEVLGPFLVATLVVPDTDEAIHESQQGRRDGGDDGSDETWLIARRVLCLEDKWSDEVS